MINSAELTIYLNNDENISFELSPMQLLIIVKILGIDYNVKNSTVNMFSDETLDYLTKIEKNPLKFKLQK